VFNLVLLTCLPAIAHAAPAAPPADWLVDPAPHRAAVRESPREIVLTNGLVSRTIRLTPAAATVALDNLMTGQAELRSVRPEASVTINGKVYPVGGLTGQPIHSYLLPEWLDTMTPIPGAFTYAGHDVGVTTPRFEWKRREAWLSSNPAWPPPGVSLTLRFNAPADAPPDGPAGVRVDVHYELYDAVPLFSKWITVHNDGPDPVTLDAFTAEILACVEPASMVGGKASDYTVFPRSLHVETDFAFGGSMDSGVDAPAVKWKPDPLYQSQVHYERQTPCLLECAPPLGPGVVIKPGEHFESFRVFELLHDSTDRERRGMAVRRMYRTTSPWVLENPLIFHVRSADPAAVRAAIDQAADVGFELVIMTFGSGFDIESTDPAYLASLKELADYAHSKGVALGGYSLLASRSIDAANDVVNPATGKPGGFATFGNSPCIGSAWGEAYFAKLFAFYEATDMDVLEHDGSYPGDACAATSHPGHAGLPDSQWTQWRTITDFYKWSRARGVYLNVPDWYYLAGSNKCGMGYRETNWSLPREQQEIIERQNIYDGTWTKTPSMGWMFVPLTEYHGGGPAATIEPLHEHLDHYETRLRNLLSAGVQACWRGPRLYDTEDTRALVKKWVAWFKAHRAILESDIIHGRRPDGRDIDWLLHVNPAIDERAMLIVHNPLAEPVTRTLRVDLRLAGLRTKASLTHDGQDAAAREITIDADGHAMIEVRVPAGGMSWTLLKAAGE
jgi:hypothetical protein